MTSQDEINRLVGYMPIIVRASGISDWERKFCASIIARNRGGFFRPSPKQVSTMKRIVRKFQDETMRDDQDVIEENR